MILSILKPVLKAPPPKHLRPLSILVGFLLCLLQTAPGLKAETPRKELPLLVAVHDLVNDAAQYDGRRVVVTGLVRSIELQRGRRGSEYILLVLEDDASKPPDGPPTIKVISATFPKIAKGQTALVQGIYHREGRQGGRPYEFFIDAEMVLHEKSLF